MSVLQKFASNLPWSFKSIVYYVDEPPITYRKKARQHAQPNATQHVVDLKCNRIYYVSNNSCKPSKKKVPEMRRIKHIHFVGIGGCVVLLRC